MVTLRSASKRDAPFLQEMLAEAADWRPETDVRTGDEVMSDPHIAHYVAGWQRDDDFGVIAHDVDVPVGAAWCRRFDADRQGYGFIAADVPELTIGVVSARRGEGIGRLLLTGLLDEARRRGTPKISLSVEADNRALDLYTAVGFVEVSRPDGSPTMVIDCT